MVSIGAADVRGLREVAPTETELYLFHYILKHHVWPPGISQLAKWLDIYEGIGPADTFGFAAQHTVGH